MNQMRKSTIRILKFEDWGLIPFEKAWNQQKEIQRAIIKAKRDNQSKSNYFVFCEHPHIYTLGKSASSDNLLISKAYMQERQIKALKINRGGDITYHGPGQVVGYPILDLDEFFTDIHKYVRFIEEIIIRSLQDHHIPAFRIPNYTGVWVKGNQRFPFKKICAIGVHLSRWVTLHGFALNVNTDLSYFDHIIPCGIMDKDKTVTSMSKELGFTIDPKTVKASILCHFKELFKVT